MLADFNNTGYIAAEKICNLMTYSLQERFCKLSSLNAAASSCRRAGFLQLFKIKSLFSPLFPQPLFRISLLSFFAP